MPPLSFQAISTSKQHPRVMREMIFDERRDEVIAVVVAGMTTRLSTGLVLAAVFALVQAWLGLTLAFYTDWPTSFWITVLSAVVYGGSLLRRR